MNVLALAAELVDTVETFDLGVQTGFSTMSRSGDSGLLDQHSDVVEMVDRLSSGEFDFLAAWDCFA